MHLSTFLFSLLFCLCSAHLFPFFERSLPILLIFSLCMSPCLYVFGSALHSLSNPFPHPFFFIFCFLSLFLSLLLSLSFGSHLNSIAIFGTFSSPALLSFVSRLPTFPPHSISITSVSSLYWPTFSQCCWTWFLEEPGQRFYKSAVRNWFSIVMGFYRQVLITMVVKYGGRGLFLGLWISRDLSFLCAHYNRTGGQFLK